MTTYGIGVVAPSFADMLSMTPTVLFDTMYNNNNNNNNNNNK